MKKIIFISAFIAFFIHMSYSQNETNDTLPKRKSEEYKNKEAKEFEEYKMRQFHKREEYKNKRAQEFAEYKNKRAQEFENYKKKRNEEFERYLKNTWKIYHQNAAYTPPIKPSPLPLYHDSVLNDTIKRKIDTIKNDIDIVFQEFSLPLLSHEKIPDSLIFKCQFMFYGTSCNIDLDKRTLDFNVIYLDKIQVVDLWDYLNKTKYDYLIKQLTDLKINMNLNDWAYYKLVEACVESLKFDLDEKIILMWFLLLKSGYDARIGYNSKCFFLLLPFQQNVYNMPYYIVEGRKYFIQNTKENVSISIYSGNHNDALKLFDLNFYSELYLEENFVENILKLNYLSENISLPVKVNRNLIKLYSDYPLCELSVHMNAPFSKAITESIWKYAGFLLRNLNDEGRVLFFLKFCQDAFEYEDDTVFHKREKYYFPDELFYYKKSDCEDRAALFAALVKKFSQLDVLGVLYNDHMSTAVTLEGNKSMSGFIYNNVHYYFCDPTQKGLMPGKCMPNHCMSTFDIIPARMNKEFVIKDSIIKLLRKNNPYNPPIISAYSFEKTSMLFCGVFSDSLFFQGKKHFTNEDSHGVFFLKTDVTGKPIFFKTFTGKGYKNVFKIVTDENDSHYIFGYFSGVLKAESHNVNSNSADAFILKLLGNGTVSWLIKLNVDRLRFDEELNAYTVLVNNEGVIEALSLRMSFKNGENNMYINPNGTLVVNGCWYTSLKSDSISDVYIAKNQIFNLEEYLFENNMALIKDNTSRSVAAIVSILNYLNFSGASVTFNNLNAFIKKLKTENLISNPGKLPNINNIEMIKNEFGLVRLYTKNNKDFESGILRFENKASFLIDNKNNIVLKNMNNVFLKLYENSFRIIDITIFKTGHVEIRYDDGRGNVSTDAGPIIN